MTERERRRLRMVERLTEVLGDDVTDTVLAHLPPSGEQVATAGQLDRLAEELRSELRAQAEAQELRMRELEHRMTAAWRKDLMILGLGQFLALTAAVTALLGLG